jgi:electron transfer flavoprotein beta subunit
MRGIMMAKRKPLKVVEAVDFTDAAKPVEYRLPEDKGGVQYLEADEMDKLVRLLHEEAKVI